MFRSRCVYRGMGRLFCHAPETHSNFTHLLRALYLFPPLQERFYFGDAVLPLFESGIPLLLQRLKQLPDAANVRGLRGGCRGGGGEGGFTDCCCSG